MSHRHGRHACWASVVLAALSIACGSNEDDDARATGGAAGSVGGADSGAAGAFDGGAGNATAGSAGSSAGAGGSAGQDAAAGGTTLIAATVNTRCLLDDWDDRKGPLADGIAALDPDLLALQEVCHSSSKDAFTELIDLVAQKTGKIYQSVRYDTHFNPLAWADEGIAIVTPHPISFQQQVDLPDGFFNRGAIVARVELPAATLLFAGTHLDFGLPDVRQKELAAVRAAVAAALLPGEAAIVAGDMNEQPDGPCMTDAFAAGYVDPWQLLHPNDPGPTSPASDPKNRIDYVLIADGSASFEITQAGIFLDQAVAGVWPSDHRGVWAKFARQQ